MSLLQLSQISKTWQLGASRVHALKNIDLTLARGEFAAVWGPSGSGKSSLLNLIGLLDQPSSGDITLLGRRMHGLHDSERALLRNIHIGFVFQSFNLLPVLSALENVMLPLTLRGVRRPSARSRALQLLGDTGLAEHAHKRPDQLSGGQRQRVAIARALVCDPALVIADEPTANLDAENSLRIISLMRQLNRERQVTFIFSTHDPRLIGEVDRLLRLEDGVLQPETPVAASLAAASPALNGHIKTAQGVWA